MENPPPSWMFDIDGRVLAFTVGATIAALLSGLLPSWMASRISAVGVLREGARRHQRPHRDRDARARRFPDRGDVRAC